MEKSRYWAKPAKTESTWIKRILAILERSPNSLFGELRPLLLTLQLTGRFPYHMDSKGIKNFQIFSWISIFSGVMFLLQSYFSIQAINKVIIWSEKQDDTSILWVNFAIVFVHNLMVPITFWFDSFSAVQYLREWEEFQDSYFLTMKTSLKFNYILRIKFLAAINIPIGIGLIFWMAKKLFFGLEPYELILPILPVVSAFNAVNYMWFFIQREIQRITDQIATRIVQWDVDGREAGELRRLWLKLVRLFTNLGNTLGNSSITFGAVNFFNSIITVYSILGCLSICKRFGSTFTQVVVFSIVYFAGWLAFIELTSQTADMIGSKFAGTLLRINLELRQPLYQREIRLILQSLDLYPPRLEMKGFFTADRNLTRVLTSSMLTYIIILLQTVPFKEYRLYQEKEQA